MVITLILILRHTVEKGSNMSTKAFKSAQDPIIDSRATGGSRQTVNNLRLTVVGRSPSLRQINA